MTVIGAVIIIIPLLIIGSIIGFIIYATHSADKTYSDSTIVSNQKTLPPKKIQSDSGWQSFCSSYGGLCLKYPADWNMTTTPINDSVASAQITSPSGSVTVEYNPICPDTTPVIAGAFTDYVESVVSPTNNNDFKIVKSIEIADYAGVKQKGAPPTSIYENFYLTTNNNIKQYQISVGTHMTNTDNEAAASYFVNTNSPTDTGVQCINVGSLKATNTNNGSSVITFSQLGEGQAWFDTAEVETAGQILASVSYVN